MTEPNRPNLSPRYRIFRGLACLSIERPWKVLLVCMAFAIASIFYTKARLEFHVGQDDLVSGNSRDTRNYHNYSSEFPDLDGLIVVVQAAPSPARAELFADTLARRLLPDHANVKSIFYQFEGATFSGGALLYMSVPELSELASKIRDDRALLNGYAAEPDLANLFKLINDEANRAMMSDMLGGLLGSITKPPATASLGQLDLGFVEAILSGMVSSDGNRTSLPWDRLTSSIGDENSVLRDGYVASDNGKYLLMQVAPGDGVAHGPDAVDVIQRDLDQVRAQFPDVVAGMTGGPALAHSEESSTAHDIALASILAIVCNVLLLVIPFGGIVEPAFALAALLVGVAWSFGFTTLAVGHLNLLSAVFTSVLAGIGINFPIHLMARYDEARKSGRTMAEAIELAVVNTGAGVVASAMIMALSFLMPMFSDFRGIAELGLVSAAGIFFCLLSAMLVFPSLVVLRDRNRGVKAAPRLKLVKRESILKRFFSRPGYVVGGSVALTLALAAFILHVGFDQNLLKLQAEGSEAVKFEGKLLKDSGRSSWFAVTLASSRIDAENKAASFRKLPEVSDAETIATYIPDRQADKRAILASLRPDLDAIKVNALTHSGDPATLARELESLRFKLASAKGVDSSGSVERTVDLLDDA